MQAIIIYLAIYWVQLLGTKHEFHTSITQLEYNQSQKIYEVSIRLFTDDFEKTLGRLAKIPKLKLTDNDPYDELVSNYLQKHLLISNAAKQAYKLKYIGKENEDIATWVYFELAPEALKAGNQISQTALMEEFSDQINIVNILNQGQKKSFIFDKETKLKTL